MSKERLSAASEAVQTVTTRTAIRENGITRFLRNRIAPILVAAGCIGGLSGCAEDREVFVPDKGTTSGNEGDGGNGSTSTNTGTDTDTDTDTDTGTDPKCGAWVKGKQVYSYNMKDECDKAEEENDPSLCYANPEYYEKKTNDMKACGADADCMDEAWNDTSGRPFQFLANDDEKGGVIYEENYQGELKGFCVYEMDNNAEGDIYLAAGEGCEDQNGNDRDCLVAGHYKLWDGSTLKQADDFGADPSVVFDFDDNDSRRKPFVACFAAEHGITVEAD
jgi:hypothetical protein